MSVSDIITDLNIRGDTQALNWREVKNALQGIITPVYDLAFGVLGVAEIFPLDAPSHTVPANKQFDHIRISQTDGSDNLFTLSSGSIVSGFSAFLTANSGSDANSNIYAGNFATKNAGSGNAKAFHATSTAIGSSDGDVIGGTLEIIPLSTSNIASAALQVDIGPGSADDVATLVMFGANSARALYGVGSVVSPTAYKYAAFQAWMATASDASARAFQVLDNSGSELAFWAKDGSIVALEIIAAAASNGITISQSEVARNNSAGSLLISAGSGAANTIQFNTGGAARFVVEDTGIRLLSSSAPASPQDGDIWYDGANVKIRVGASTKTFTLT